MFFKTELGLLQEQIEKRKERLNTLINQRQELDQAAQRLVVWCEDKQRLISPDQMIPLKTTEIERLQKKFNVNYPKDISFQNSLSFLLGYIKRIKISTDNLR
jgi:hypothetical protein